MADRNPPKRYESWNPGQGVHVVYETNDERRSQLHAEEHPRLASADSDLFDQPGFHGRITGGDEWGRVVTADDIPTVPDLRVVKATDRTPHWGWLVVFVVGYLLVVALIVSAGILTITNPQEIGGTS